MSKESSDNNKIKVLNLITKSDWAGAQRVVFEISKGIKDNFNDELEIEVAMGGKGPLFNKLEKLGVNTYKINHLQRKINLFTDLKAYREIKKLIIKNNYDVVHCHSSKAGFLGRIAAKKCNVPKIIYTIHGWWGVTQYKGIKRKLILLLERIMAKKTDKIVFVCNKDKEFANNNKIGADKQHEVIINQISEPKYPKGKLRNMLDLSKSVKIIGNVARLSQQKNPVRFVEVAKKTLEKRKDIMFVWIGDGELKSRLKHLVEEYNIEDNTKFIGFHKNGAELMADFDCLLMTSDDEGLPITILEAIAQKIPIVSTDVGGVREVLKNRDVVLSINENVVENLQKKVISILSHKVNYKQEQKEYSVEKMFTSYAQLYFR